MNKIFRIFIGFMWSALIFISGAWNVHQTKETWEEVNLASARSLFKLMVTTRAWNADYVGVYVPVTDKTQPNPYLDVPDRDIILPDGQILTKINPAYMTRLVAELAEEYNNVSFHITSLKPIRSANAAYPWEKKALTAFEEEGKEDIFYWDETTQSFKYMAPLITTENCLVCHAKQGYKVGDIRGGISVTIPSKPADVRLIVISHLVIGFIGLVGIFFATNRLNIAFSNLEQQTHIDGLTKVYNRSFFDDYLRMEFLRSKRQQTPLSLILCDIDYFKDYNDTYGHLAGDECLRKIAKSLNDTIRRPADVVARYGGDEFAIILPETHAQGAEVVSQMLRANVEALAIPHKASKISDHVTISLGHQTYTGEDITLEEFIEKVDKALYAAKNAGKNLAIG